MILHNKLLASKTDTATTGLTPSVVDDGESNAGGDDEVGPWGTGEGGSGAGDDDGDAGGEAWEDEDAPEAPEARVLFDKYILVVQGTF
ncbi:hypothetical protein VKT23_006174 [Stygiomarasmius scandens]|uniref:Uncharacterized protein n=1 Tax=Marasmiellus scandens TaxID=2682957 RepID=A0ABR1JPB9_9AGAR